MSNANMKLVTLDVLLADKLETPPQKLDAGEFIVRRVVKLESLKQELKGRLCSLFSTTKCLQLSQIMIRRLVTLHLVVLGLTILPGFRRRRTSISLRNWL